MFLLYDGHGYVVGRYATERGAKIANTRKHSGILGVTDDVALVRKTRALYIESVGGKIERVDGVPTGRVATRNILNPTAGEIWIDAMSYGTCVDPGTERYHCM